MLQPLVSINDIRQPSRDDRVTAMQPRSLVHGELELDELLAHLQKEAGFRDMLNDTTHALANIRRDWETSSS